MNDTYIYSGVSTTENHLILIDARIAGTDQYISVTLNTNDVAQHITDINGAKNIIIEKNRAKLEQQLSNLKDERKALEVRIQTLSKELSI